MQLFAALGLYLILAFVLPGFCYLLAFGLCFPGEFQAVQKWLPRDDKDVVQGFSLFSFALVLGLLVSSVTFAFEVVLRTSLPDFFHKWYPEIDFTTAHESNSYATVLVPSAIMHFNIGLGTLIILIVYIFYVTRRREWAGQASAGQERSEAGARSRKFFLVLPNFWLAIAMATIVVANMIVASEVYRRVHDLSPATDKKSSAAGYLRNFPTSMLDGPPQRAVSCPDALIFASVAARSANAVTISPPLSRMKYST
jgi:multisubunit Na+/H+ antiporter MnhB subunit